MAASSETLESLHSQLLTHSEERRYLQRVDKRLKDTFGNPTHRSYQTLKAKAYRVSNSLGLKGFAERLIPIETTRREFSLVRDEEARIKGQISQEVRRIRKSSSK